MTMASFRVGLVDYLKTRAAIVALVADRMHPSVLPDVPPADVRLPAIVYRIITNVGEFTHDSAVNLRNPRLQLDVYARRQLEAESVAAQLELALLGYRGPMGDMDYTAGWQLEDSTDIFETDTRFYRISQDWRGWYAPQEEVT